MDQNPIILTLDAGSTLNYALQQNQFPLIRMA